MLDNACNDEIRIECFSALPKSSNICSTRTTFSSSLKIFFFFTILSNLKGRATELNNFMEDLQQYPYNHILSSNEKYIFVF